MISTLHYTGSYEPAHLAVSYPRVLATEAAAAHSLCLPAAWGPARSPVAVAVVGDCRSPDPACTALAVVVACVLALAEAGARMHLRRCTAAAVVRVHIRPAGRCSSHHPSRADRIRADHNRNRSIADHAGCRSLHTAPVPAVRAADRSIAAAAAAVVVAVEVAAGGRRTVAGMPWRRGVRYRQSGLSKATCTGRVNRGVVLRIGPLCGGDLEPLK